jgi:hypothetical protein
MSIKAVDTSIPAGIQQNIQNDVNFYYDSNITTQLFNKVMGPIVGSRLTLAGFVTVTPVATEHNFREFNQWLNDNRGIEVTQAFENLHDHKLLQEFLDPITHKVMLDPVRTPEEKIFDRSTLKALAQLRTDGKILNSDSTISFTLSQVVDAPEVWAKLEATYNSIIGHTQLSPGVEKGLRIFIKDLHRNVNTVIANKMHALTDDLNSDKITREQFADKTLELIAKMNPSI